MARKKNKWHFSPLILSCMYKMNFSHLYPIVSSHPQCLLMKSFSRLLCVWTSEFNWGCFHEHGQLISVYPAEDSVINCISPSGRDGAPRAPPPPMIKCSWVGPILFRLCAGNHKWNDAIPRCLKSWVDCDSFPELATQTPQLRAKYLIFPVEKTLIIVASCLWKLIEAITDTHCVCPHL